MPNSFSSSRVGFFPRPSAFSGDSMAAFQMRASILALAVGFALGKSGKASPVVGRMCRSLSRFLACASLSRASISLASLAIMSCAICLERCAQLSTEIGEPPSAAGFATVSAATFLGHGAGSLADGTAAGVAPQRESGCSACRATRMRRRMSSASLSVTKLGAILEGGSTLGGGRKADAGSGGSATGSSSAFARSTARA